MSHTHAQIHSSLPNLCTTMLQRSLEAFTAQRNLPADASLWTSHRALTDAEALGTSVMHCDIPELGMKFLFTTNKPDHDILLEQPRWDETFQNRQMVCSGPISYHLSRKLEPDEGHL